ncbi:MAG: class I SAM-dependent methyltransferase [Gemmatimonadales bacterium]
MGTADEEYQPFPNEDGRNLRQELLELPAMIQALGLPRGVRVMEVGCGRGIALPVLARCLAPTCLVGVDVDATLLSVAGVALEIGSVHADLAVADIRALPFPDASFDLLIDFGTCFHVAYPDRALQEIERVLVPGGLFATETKLSQLMSHPIRASGRFLPWGAAPSLLPDRHALLWETRRRTSA